MSRRAQLVGSLVNAALSERTERLLETVRAVAQPAGRLECFYQVDDPYSCLLGQRLGELVSGAGLELSFVLVPAPRPEVDPQPELRRRYALADAAELARRYELAFPHGAHAPDPSDVLLANAILLRERPPLEQLALATAASAALFAGDRAELAALARQHGRLEGESVAAALERGARRLARAGHYQPAMVRYRGGWYWGVDRLPHLEARLRAEGRAARRVLVPRRGVELPPVELSDGPPALDFFFSFRSPYSYLAIDRAARLAERYGVRLRIKPVLPMVMRGLAVPRIKRLYILRDAAREARRLGIPFGRICDPLGVGVERCLAVFGYARRENRELAFIASAARGIWSEALDVAHDDDLAIIVRRAGLEWSTAQRSLADLDWPEKAERNRQELLSLGLWGVPSFRVGDYACWGQDRLDSIEDRLAWLWWSEPEERPMTEAP